MITDLRQQIAHLRTKLTSGVENKKDDVLEMEVRDVYHSSLVPIEKYCLDL